MENEMEGEGKVGKGTRRWTETREPLKVILPNPLIESDKKTPSLRSLKLLYLVEFYLSEKVKERGTEWLLDTNDLELNFTYSDLKREFKNYPHLRNTLRGLFYTATKSFKGVWISWGGKEKEWIEKWIEKNYDKDSKEYRVVKEIFNMYKDGKTVFVPIIEVSYSEGVLHFRVHKLLKIFFLKRGRKKEWTGIPLSIVLKFRRKGSIKLYEKVKRFQLAGRREISVEDLYSLFELENDERKKVGYDFGVVRANYLDPAIEEINKRSDIRVSYREKKKGKKVIKVEFYIQSGNEGAEEEREAFSKASKEKLESERREGERYERQGDKFSPKSSQQLKQPPKLNGRKEKKLFKNRAIAERYFMEKLKKFRELAYEKLVKKGLIREGEDNELFNEAIDVVLKLWELYRDRCSDCHRYYSLRALKLRDDIMLGIPYEYLIELGRREGLERLDELEEAYEMGYIKNLKAYIKGILDNEYGVIVKEEKNIRKRELVKILVEGLKKYITGLMSRVEIVVEKG